MKTRIIITAAIIFFTVSIASSQSLLKFRTADGVELIQPVQTEEAPDTAPAFESVIIDCNSPCVSYEHFDIAKFSAPEKEEPLPFDLDEVLKSLNK
ncbi:MAG: hypothetical protein ACLFN2_07775 [Bacteroidales bacterium]